MRNNVPAVALLPWLLNLPVAHRLVITVTLVIIGNNIPLAALVTFVTNGTGTTDCFFSTVTLVTKVPMFLQLLWLPGLLLLTVTYIVDYLVTTNM
jgi:hypothetical protein